MAATNAVTCIVRFSTILPIGLSPPDVQTRRTSGDGRVHASVVSTVVCISVSVGRRRVTVDLRTPGVGVHAAVCQECLVGPSLDNLAVVHNDDTVGILDR